MTVLLEAVSFCPRRPAKASDEVMGLLNTYRAGFERWELTEEIDGLTSESLAKEISLYQTRMTHHSFDLNSAQCCCDAAIPGRPTTPVNTRFFESAFVNIF